MFFKDMIETDSVSEQRPAAAVSEVYHIVALCVCLTITRWNPLQRPRVALKSSCWCVRIYSLINKYIKIHISQSSNTTKLPHLKYPRRNKYVEFKYLRTSFTGECAEQIREDLPLWETSKCMRFPHTYTQCSYFCAG